MSKAVINVIDTKPIGVKFSELEEGAYFTYTFEEEGCDDITERLMQKVTLYKWNSTGWICYGARVHDGLLMEFGNDAIVIPVESIDIQVKVKG